MVHAERLVPAGQPRRRARPDRRSHVLRCRSITPELFALRNDPVTFARKLDPGSFFGHQEKTKALYGSIGLGGQIGERPWSGVLGVRFVRTEQTLRGNIAGGISDDGIIVYTPSVQEQEDDDVLPSATFKLSFTPNLIGRLALSRTVSRPNFDDLNPGVTISSIISNTTSLTGEAGNADLQSVPSDNLDIALEWYFARAGSLTATAFARKFEGYVQNTMEIRNIGGDDFRITFPVNTGNGDLIGMELGYQQFYDWLPSVSVACGLQTNVTYMNGTTEDRLTGVERTITGISRLGVQRHRSVRARAWSGRLAYNWRSKFPDIYAFVDELHGHLRSQGRR